MKEFTLIELKQVTQDLSVLYVEDEKMIRDGLLGSLKQLFKEVEVAEDGAIGWELYKNSRFHLIITDISMPNMDGISMISHIMEKNPEARIIVTSAQNDAEKLLTLINLGVDRFLTKPINKLNLINALYTVCSSIANKRKIKAYHLELEQKIRLLNTQMKKEHVKTKQAQLIDEKKSDQIYDDYFSFLVREDIDELIELNEELDSDILLAFQNDRIDPTYVTRLSQRYNRYGTVLCRYTAFNEIGTQIHFMSNELDTHHQIFIDHSSSILELLESFNFTLITFRQNVLEKESPNPTFYNPSILSDITMISNLLSQIEVDGDIEFF
ncbi:MAG: response regulator [Sulfuricurvum sp.]|nr:response regulator [Sulfuricurvum sp.]MDD5386805.1 response regulator [Sulfuricurvum sp.]